VQHADNQLGSVAAGLKTHHEFRDLKNDEGLFAATKSDRCRDSLPGIGFGVPAWSQLSQGAGFGYRQEPSRTSEEAGFLPGKTLVLNGP
jgi:hypothetical protein